MNNTKETDQVDYEIISGVLAKGEYTKTVWQLGNPSLSQEDRLNLLRPILSHEFAKVSPDTLEHLLALAANYGQQK